MDWFVLLGEPVHTELVHMEILLPNGNFTREWDVDHVRISIITSYGCLHWAIFLINNDLVCIPLYQRAEFAVVFNKSS